MGADRKDVERFPELSPFTFSRTGGPVPAWWASECLARKLTSHPFSNWILPVYLFLSVARTIKAFGRISFFAITVESHVKGQSTLAVEISLARLADLDLK